MGRLYFLYLCYKKVEAYFSDKAIREKNKDEQIQDVIDRQRNIPAWHQQSVDIQRRFTGAIEDLRRIPEGNDTASAKPGRRDTAQGKKQAPGPAPTVVSVLH